MNYLRAILVISAILVVLTACQGSSEPLRANAGDDYSVKVGEQPTFDDCSSTGDIENYKWMIASGPEQVSEDTNKIICEVEPRCAFTLAAAMKPEEAGEWVLRLEVKDAQGNTSTDEVVVSVVP